MPPELLMHRGEEKIVRIGNWVGYQIGEQVKHISSFRCFGWAGFKLQGWQANQDPYVWRYDAAKREVQP